MRIIQFIVLFFFIYTNSSCDESNGRKRSNIICFVVDDLGWTDLGFMGNTYNSTPNIDKIANQGTIFTHAYANAPNCAPTRACILSGQYAPRHGVYTVGSPERGKSIFRKIIPTPNNTRLSKDNLTFAEILTQHDYVTAHFGKWHLGDGETGPLNQGFDYNFGGNQAGHPSSYFSPYKNKDLPDGPDGEYLTDRLVDEALKFIDQYQDSSFFMYFPFYNVHTPLQAKEEMIKKYIHKNCLRAKCNPTYAAMIQSVDDAIGKIYNQLDGLGLLSNTVIIFTSDNGPYLPASTAEPLRGSKGMIYEGGIRVPLFLWHPQLNGLTVTCEEPVISLDLYPTILDIANIEIPESKITDGESIIPLLEGKRLDRDKLFWHFPAYLERYPGVKHIWRTTPVGAMRKGPWKIIEFFEDGRIELYNLIDDPSETTELSNDHPDIVTELMDELKLWRSEINASVPNSINPEFNIKLYHEAFRQIIDNPDE